MTKTKQIARKSKPQTKSEIRKEERLEAKAQKAEKRYVARELAMAAKLLKDGPKEKRVTRSVDVPAKPKAVDPCGPFFSY